jgi:hypothetical protein
VSGKQRLFWLSKSPVLYTSSQTSQLALTTVTFATLLAPSPRTAKSQLIIILSTQLTHVDSFIIVKPSILWTFNTSPDVAQPGETASGPIHLAGHRGLDCAECGIRSLALTAAA